MIKKICLLLCLASLAAAAESGAEVSAKQLQDVTGVATWSSTSRNRISTAQPDFPRQNADFSKPLSFTKLDHSGKDLPDSADSWACVRDNLSGLVWEAKTSDGGLHDKSYTYTWYSSDENSNGGRMGVEGEPDNTTCGTPAVVAAGCDTEKFVAAVNKAGWCGQKDWRMPTVNELYSIANYGASLPAISEKYFPDLIMPAGFWTASPYAANPAFAWIVIFDDGYVGSCVKSWAYYLRLVRGGN